MRDRVVLAIVCATVVALAFIFAVFIFPTLTFDERFALGRVLAAGAVFVPIFVIWHMLFKHM
jgi:drug/metabolite transporter superfamily protein YnfA